MEMAEVQAVAARAQFSGEFRRDLQDSDALHWGEGKVAIGRDEVAEEVVRDGLGPGGSRDPAVPALRRNHALVAAALSALTTSLLAAPGTSST